MKQAASIQIVHATTVDQELVAAFARLLPQLSRTAFIPTKEELTELIHSPCNTVLMARDLRSNGRYVGTLTLVMFRIPTGLRAWIEDVVVDKDARGRGIGELLNREALRLASKKGVRSVDLTSRPDRIEANGLYKEIGFGLRKTNAYRFPDPKEVETIVFQERPHD